MANATRRAILAGIAALSGTVLPIAAIASPSVADASDDKRLIDLLRQLKAAELASCEASDASDTAEFAAKEKLPPAPRAALAILRTDGEQPRFVVASRHYLERIPRAAVRARRLAAHDAWVAECDAVFAAHNCPGLKRRSADAAAETSRLYREFSTTPAATVAGMLVKLRWAVELTAIDMSGQHWPTLSEAYDNEAHEGLDLLDAIVLSLWGDAVRITGASPDQAGAPRLLGGAA